MIILLWRLDFWMARMWHVCSDVSRWHIHPRAYTHSFSERSKDFSDVAILGQKVLISKRSEDFSRGAILSWEALISERSEDFSRGAILGREALISERSEDFGRGAILGREVLISESSKDSVTELYWAERRWSLREMRTSVAELMGSWGLMLVLLFWSKDFPSWNTKT